MGSGHSHGHLKAVDGEGDPKIPGKSAKARTSFVIPQVWLEWVEDEAARQGVSKSAIYMQALAEYRDRHQGQLWDTVDDPTGYDPKKFYTQSRDKQGHSSHFRVNLPTNIGGHIRALIASGGVPQYQTAESLIRDGAMHRLMQVSQWLDNGELAQAVSVSMLLAEEIQMAEDDKAAEQLVERIRENANRLIGQGDWRRAKTYLADRADLVQSLPAPWNKELERLLKDLGARVQRGQG